MTKTSLERDLLESSQVDEKVSKKRLKKLLIKLERVIEERSDYIANICVSLSICAYNTRLIAITKKQLRKGGNKFQMIFQLFLGNLFSLLGIFHINFL